MATFSELIQFVYDATGRPDLVAETKLAVKSATLKAHQSDFYFKDIFESGIQFDTAEYTQQLNVRSIFPRYRALKYLRRYDNSSTGAACNFYTLLSAGELLDDYSQDRVNIAYAAGAVINIKSYEKLQYALIGIYLNPDITEVGYNSWVAVDHPFCIVYEAARLVFKQIGFDEQSAAMDKLAAEQFTLLKMSNVQLGGY